MHPTPAHPYRRTTQAAALLTGGLLLAACSSSGTTSPTVSAPPPTPTPTATPSSSPSPTTPSVSPTPTPKPSTPVGPAALGTTSPWKMLDVGNGKTTGTATPAEYKQGIAKNAPTPETAYGTQFKDYVWASLKATICSDASSAATIPGEATTWDLTYADGAVVEATAAGYPEFPQPEFPQAGQLAPGHCITGTITYAVPAATRPAHVQYGMALDKPLEWNIPQQ